MNFDKSQVDTMDAIELAEKLEEYFKDEFIDPLTACQLCIWYGTKLWAGYGMTEAELLRSVSAIFRGFTEDREMN